MNTNIFLNEIGTWSKKSNYTKFTKSKKEPIILNLRQIPWQTMNTEELELLSDSKYRQFINAVEKALRSFEYSSEWADLISALGKLNKVHLTFSPLDVLWFALKTNAGSLYHCNSWF